MEYDGMLVRTYQQFLDDEKKRIERHFMDIINELKRELQPIADLEEANRKNAELREKIASGIKEVNNYGDWYLQSEFTLKKIKKMYASKEWKLSEGNKVLYEQVEYRLGETSDEDEDDEFPVRQVKSLVYLCKRKPPVKRSLSLPTFRETAKQRRDKPPIIYNKPTGRLRTQRRYRFNSSQDEISFITSSMPRRKNAFLRFCSRTFLRGMVFLCCIKPNYD